jgi:hypothetical protein
MTPTTTTPAFRPTTARAPQPDPSDRPVVVRSSRARLVAVGALVLAVGVAVVVSLMVRSGGTATEVASPTVAAAAASTVGDTAHGGPGSRADVLRDAPSTPARSAAAPGETVHGGPGSRTDAVRPLAPHPSDVRVADAPVADVAHGTAGAIVTASSGRP